MVFPVPQRSRSLRRLAIASAVLLGCTTVRAPVSFIAPTIPVRDGRPEPQVELWLEGNRPATPEESAQATAQARAALDQALAGRVADDPDDLLVVRVQGVTRTPARRSDQHAAVAGIVVGAVVIVAAVVILIVAESKGGGGGGHSVPNLGGVHASGGGGGAHLGRAAPVGLAHASVPHFHSGPTRLPGPGRIASGAPTRLPAPVRPQRPGLPPPRPVYPGHSHPDTSVGISLEADVWLGPPVPEQPAAPPEYLAAQPPPERPPALDAPPPPPDQPAPNDVETDEPPPQEPAPDELAALELPPPAPLAVAARGFFEGDSVVLEAIVVDRTTGQPRWQKAISRGVDPRDPKAMKAAVDVLLSDGGWTPVY